MKTGGRIREHAATVVVSAISTAFASGLILLTGILTAALDPRLVEESGTFRATLLVVSFIFVAIALYVGAIVTANTFATIIAGRTRTIALLRLVGASSRRVRARVAGEGLLMGTLGAAIGFGIATALAAAVGAWGPGLGWLPEGRDYPILDPLAPLGAVVVILTTWVAAWAGSRRVGRVSPVAATGAAIDANAAEAAAKPARTVWAIILLAFGAVLLALGLLLGMLMPLGILVAFFGGLFSCTGIVLGAHLIVPPLLRLTARLFTGSVTGRLAAANAERYPERSARSTIGLVIGVTLVTMFAVALDSYRSMSLLAFANDPELADRLNDTLAITTAILTGLAAFSAVIAAVGVVNTLSLSVLQRTRELGLLRALGCTGAQIRGMVLVESAQMILAALGFGLLLGVFYGWIAAQSMLGSQSGWAPPSVPWLAVAGVVVFGAVVALIAAALPARRATRVAPVVALAVD
ncbi:ABC transporter permease [Leucobacter massiliensis]|uniref:ABC transporter permease n=1 Tax=Leucobacter massiliensis TaxID=1686285 RepID=A0A2S9QP67_9MICO|nr:ABC transporter permease [Leucobacter massiliensis]PRI11391.1 ABC transporter permease [Leucobacter massiliensis]